jgi:4-amino-4-deoxy-L-arabinose transferase-like glycosyltransferase
MEKPTNPRGEVLPVRGAILLFALAAALLLLRLGSVPLLGPDEPRYARVAVEMYRSGDFVTPTLQGQPWLEKPPLYYWLASAAFRIFGETETAARLPAVAAGLLLVGTTAMLGARLYGAAAGLHAGLILATSLLAFAYARAATMDMLVAAPITVAIGLLALGLFGIAGRLAIPVAWAAIGFACLAKGPLGLLLPGLVVIGYAAATRSWEPLRRLLSPAGLILFALVAGPWYALILVSQGHHFLAVFLLNHNLQRFTSTIHNHPGPILYYVPLLLGGLFPWSGLLLAGLSCARPRTSRVDLFVMLWLLLPLLFFSTAGSKLPGYILPCLAPLALLMGRAAAAMTEGVSLPFWAGPRAAALVGIALGALVATTPALLLRIQETAWPQTLPLGLWALIATFAASRAWKQSPRSALALLRVGGAGLLLLLALAAPPILARQQSGRELFLPAAHREVLAWGAWRTAWMSGYFYNDGKVREVADLSKIHAAASSGPALVLCGPSERRQLEASPAFTTLTLAEGPKQNALLRVSLR